MGDTGSDAHRVLRVWHENMRSDPRLAGWDTEFRAGEDYPRCEEARTLEVGLDLVGAAGFEPA